jgi:hypothetical protein
VNYYGGRIRHESPEDLAREQEIAEEVEAHWGVHAVKLHDRDVLDRALMPYLYKGIGRPPPITALAEIKWRKTIFGIGGPNEGFWISMIKIFRAQQWDASTRKPVWLIVRFNDGVIRCARLRFPLPEPDRNAVYGGRGDRPHDKTSVEPEGVVPWSWFRKLYDDTDNL